MAHQQPLGLELEPPAQVEIGLVIAMLNVVVTVAQPFGNWGALDNDITRDELIE